MCTFPTWLSWHRYFATLSGIFIDTVMADWNWNIFVGWTSSYFLFLRRSGCVGATLLTVMESKMVYIDITGIILVASSTTSLKKLHGTIKFICICVPGIWGCVGVCGGVGVGGLWLCLSLCVHAYACACACAYTQVYIYIYVYIYISCCILQIFKCNNYL